MSGHIGLREDARVGRRLARRIAALFAPRETAGNPAGCTRPTQWKP